MFFTSYLSSSAPQARKVCIAKWHRFWKGACAKQFAPSNPKAVNWQDAFVADLEYRFPSVEILVNYLTSIEKLVADPIFCCYEKNPAECHRSVLARWVESKTGIVMLEWQAPLLENFPAAGK